jgi:hypothetical protein
MTDAFLVRLMPCLQGVSIHRKLSYVPVGYSKKAILSHCHSLICMVGVIAFNLIIRLLGKRRDCKKQG